MGWAKRNGYQLWEGQSDLSFAIAGFKEQFLADFGEGSDWENPLIDLAYVKPGDRGEVTLSLRLFNNGGHARMIGEKNADAENDYDWRDDHSPPSIAVETTASEDYTDQRTTASGNIALGEAQND
jgi:putative transposase